MRASGSIKRRPARLIPAEPDVRPEPEVVNDVRPKYVAPPLNERPLQVRLYRSVGISKIGAKLDAEKAAKNAKEREKIENAKKLGRDVIVTYID